MIGTRYVPVGYVQFTAGGTAGGIASLSGTILPGRATRALMQCETTNVRWRDDGGPLTTNVGMLLIAGLGPFDYSGNLAALQFLSTGAPAIVDVTLYQDVG